MIAGNRGLSREGILCGIATLGAYGGYLSACTTNAVTVIVTEGSDGSSVLSDSGMAVSLEDAGADAADGNSDAAFDSGRLYPDGGMGGPYFTSCLTQLAFADVRKVLRFYTVIQYTPADDGGDTLNLTMTPMRGFDPDAGPIDGITGKPSGELVAPDNFSLTFARGPAIPVAGSVDQTGAFTANMGNVSLSSEANPISGRPIKIETTLLKGRFASSTDTFCSTLSGQVVVPIQQPLTASDNICLFVPLKDGDPLPVQVKADFVCNVQ